VEGEREPLSDAAAQSFMPCPLWFALLPFGLPAIHASPAAAQRIEQRWLIDG